VLGEPDDDLPEGELHATADEADERRLARLQSLGFTPQRRDLVLLLPTDAMRWARPRADPPPGVAFRTADQVDETQLRLLDDLLRQEVPGTSGWRWDPQAFWEETYESPHFDPETYLVAVDGDGEYVAIARVWMRPERPRLGFVGVRADWRRKGLGRALVAAVLTVLSGRGFPEIEAEVDEANAASRALLHGFGGRPIGGSIELVRRPDTVASRRRARARSEGRHPSGRS
jgi:RimJ/RimL family protein N-acetyltransferase